MSMTCSCCRDDFIPCTPVIEINTQANIEADQAKVADLNNCYLVRCGELEKVYVLIIIPYITIVTSLELGRGTVVSNR